ncbi:MAG: hypothetical protein IAE80_07085 [Anaerolinea sp.]|nr:hypothetical protein [Anaerolinea sp.]
MIAKAFFEAGLIQFGVFNRHNESFPFDLALSLLGSYPDLLASVTEQAAGLIGQRAFSRLLATADAIPFGTALSLHLRIPLVYSRGTGATPVDDLVGAYDIGHAALLVTNSLGCASSFDGLVAGARRVGLEINAAVCIVQCRQIAVNGVDVLPLLTLQAVVDHLTAMDEIPAGQADAVRRWISR